MAQQFIESHVRKLSLFERLPADQFELVASAFQVLRFEPGALVFRQGQPAQGLFLVVAGRGILTHFEPDPANPMNPPIDQPIGEVNANEFVGEAALFAQQTENASLHIVEPTIILFLSRQRFAALLAQHPEIRTNLGMQWGDQDQSRHNVFSGQRADEVVLQIYRRHWWSFARFSWLPLLVAAALVFVAVTFAENPILALGLVGLALIIPSGIMYYLYTEWQDDCIIVTDQRVVRVQNVWFGLQNSLAEIPLDQVHEVSIEVPAADPAARAFNYATVRVRTSGQASPLYLSMIRQPDRLRESIFAYRERFRESVAQQNRNAVEVEINKVLGLENDDNRPPGSGVARGQPVGAQRDRSLNPLRTKYINDNGDVVYRKHVTVWLGHVLAPATLLLVSIFAIPVTLFIPEISTQLGVLGPVFAFFMALASALWLYLADWDWRYDEFRMGDEMITLTRRRPLWLQNETDQVRLDKIDNVVSSMSGLLNAALRRGKVEISLIGSDVSKVIGPVYQPHEVQAEISARLARLRQLAQRAEAQRQREAMTEFLSAYHQKVTQQNDDYEAVPQQTVASPVARPAQTQRMEPEPPPQPIRDGSRPPRIPRVLPEELP